MRKFALSILEGFKIETFRGNHLQPFFLCLFTVFLRPVKFVPVHVQIDIMSHFVGHVTGTATQGLSIFGMTRAFRDDVYAVGWVKEVHEKDLVPSIERVSVLQKLMRQARIQHMFF